MVTKCETEELLRQELERYDVKYVFGYGGRHAFVKIVCGEQSRKVSYSKTRTDFHGVLNARANLRARLRELGAQEKARI